ncbi:hypothetical protein [Methanosarcina barkeri]|uniref:hypothetical protein n=1 Tax=Methanosarcina barkeri TaxID=2208 RepID=UPI0012D48FC6|nr:hypothetical protein [Methanosarcina barkeri]
MQEPFPVCLRVTTSNIPHNTARLTHLSLDNIYILYRFWLIWKTLIMPMDKYEMALTKNK